MPVTRASPSPPSRPSKRPRVSAASPVALKSPKAKPLAVPRYLTASAPSTALARLCDEGYVLLRGVVPAHLCSSAAAAIQTDLGARLDAGSTHQQEPIRMLKPATQRAMRAVVSAVLDGAFKRILGMRDACVPASWDDTLYGRLKRSHFHTPAHADAFNTIFERKLLARLTPQQHPAWARFLNSGSLDAHWSTLPIWTFWVALSPVTSAKTSHLRVEPGSHALPGIRLVNGSAVQPAGYKYRRDCMRGPAFASPNQDGGYAPGDVVVFHCLTQHEANAQTGNVDGERVSLDGRVFARLI